MPTPEARLVLWGKIHTSTTDDENLNDWWTNEHLPERLNLPGFKRARRYYRTPSNPNGGLDSNSTEYLACYCVSSVQDLTSPEYMHTLENPTMRTQKFMPVLARMNREACTVVSQFNKSNVLGNWLIVVPVHGEEDFEAVRDVRNVCGELLTLCSFTHLVRDDVATRTGSATKSYERVEFGGAGFDEDGAERRGTHTGMLLIELATKDVKRSPGIEKIENAWIQALERKKGSRVRASFPYKAFKLLCSMESRQ